MAQMMPAPLQPAPLQPAPPQTSRRVNRSARFSNQNTRDRLESLINSISLNNTEKYLLIDLWIPTIVDLEKKAVRGRLWHNILMIISGCAKVVILILASEAFGISGFLALLNHIAILVLVLLIGISDLLEISFHLDRKGRSFEEVQKMEMEYLSFLHTPASYENSQNETEALDKLIKKLQIMRNSPSFTYS